MTQPAVPIEDADDVEPEAFGPRRRDEDQLVVINGVDFRTYAALRELLDSPGIRMTYLKGALEIMSPSWRHENYKKGIARLVEAFALARDIPLNGYGSTTFKREAHERGLEPDECYCIGRVLGDEGTPDIALEVVLTSGGINKLAVYRGLGVKEVWFYRNGRFELYTLDGGRYGQIERSLLVPDLDFRVIEELAVLPDQHAAVKALWQRLHG
jgi:Uma2 family endonuclease